MIAPKHQFLGSKAALCSKQRNDMLLQINMTQVSEVVK